MALRNRKTRFSKETKIVGKGRKKKLPSDGWNPYGLVKKKKKNKKKIRKWEAQQLEAFCVCVCVNGMNYSAYYSRAEQ
jgi:hypothetical protein